MIRRKTEDLSGRSLDANIWSLLWPLLVLTVIQRIGNTFEGVLVSVNSTEELSIMGICSPYITLITTVSYGMGIAANSLVSSLCSDGVWAGCWRRAGKAAGVLLLVFCLCMSGLTAVLLYLAFSGIPKLAGLGWLYMLPYLFGNWTLLLFTLLINAMRGLGDSKAGMWMTMLYVPMQLLICWVGYTVFGLAGLGYGTVLGHGIGCIFGFCRIRKYLPKEGGKEAMPDGSVRKFLTLGIPVSLSKAIAPTANAAVNALLLTFGAVYVGANGLGSRLESFFYMPAMSMGTVAISITAGNLKKYGAKRTITHLCLWSTVPTLVMVIGAYLFAEPLWTMLTPDPELQKVGVSYWYLCLLAYPMIALEMSITGILQALGQGLPSLVITAVRTWGIQFPMAWLAVRFGWGPTGVWMGFVLGNVASVIISGTWAYLKLRQSNQKTTGKNPALQAKR